MIFFFARSFKTYQAGISLLRLGFPQDAAVLARVLREASYQAAWLTMEGDAAAKLFLQDYERNARHMVRTLAEVAEPAELRVRAQEASRELSVDEELDAWWRNWWGKSKSIKWLAEELGAEVDYRIEYGSLSAFVHTSPALLNYYFRMPEGGGLVIETRPGITFENQGLAATTLWTILSAFRFVCNLLAHDFDFGLQNELVEIETDMKALAEQWKSASATSR